MAISSELTSPNCHCICGRLITYWRSYPGVTVLSLEFQRIIRDLDLTSYGWAYCEIFKDVVGVRIRKDGGGRRFYPVCSDRGSQKGGCHLGGRTTPPANQKLWKTWAHPGIFPSQTLTTAMSLIRLFNKKSC